MAITLNTQNVIDRIIALVNAEVATWAAAERPPVVAMGDLSDLPSPADLDTWLPAVLVEADPVKVGKPSRHLQREVSYPMNVIYLRKLDFDSDYHRTVVSFTNLLALKLDGSYNLAYGDTGLRWTVGGTMGVKACWADEVNYNFVDRDFRILELPVRAARIHLQVEAWTTDT